MFSSIVAHPSCIIEGGVPGTGTAGAGGGGITATEMTSLSTEISALAFVAPGGKVYVLTSVMVEGAVGVPIGQNELMVFCNGQVPPLPNGAWAWNRFLFPMINDDCVTRQVA
jgi:hypothetical protein